MTDMQSIIAETAKQAAEKTKAEIFAALNLENGIGDYRTSSMPCMEGETDIARHRVRVTMPDGEVVNFTGATEADMVKNVIARVSGNTTSTRGDIPTVDEYAEKWYNLVWKPKETALNNTAVNVHTYVYTHIRPRFAGRQLDEVKRSDVQAYSNELQAQGKAASTIDKIMIYLRQIFEMAVDDELIKNNPVKKIDKGDKETKREPLTANQVKTILASMKHLRPYDMLLVAIPLFAGTRKEETLGLQWRDIDWNAHTITIERAVKTLREPHYHTVIGPLKSPSSYRTVPLMPELEAILLPLRGADHEQIVSGSKLMTQSAYQCAWDRIEAKIELYDSTAHSYRHTFATFALEDIDPKTLQSVLGHSDFSTTMNTYVHARKDKVKGLYQTMGGMYQRACANAH